MPIIILFQGSKLITVNVKTPKDKKSITVDEKATIKEVNICIYRQILMYFKILRHEFIKSVSFMSVISQ